MTPANPCPECGAETVKVGDAPRCVSCPYGWPWHKK
jgi:hypothetical protein